MSAPRGGSGRYTVDRHRAERRARQAVRTRGRGVSTSAQRAGGLPSPARVATQSRNSTLRRIRRQLGGKQTGIWAVITLLLATAALLTYTLGWTVATLTTLTVTGIVNRVEARRAGDSAPPPPRKIATSRARAAGTPPRDAPARPRPGASAPAAGGGRKAVCNARCRASTKPKTPANCSCKADPCFHGSEASALKG